MFVSEYIFPVLFMNLIDPLADGVDDLRLAHSSSFSFPLIPEFPCTHNRINLFISVSNLNSPLHSQISPYVTSGFVNAQVQPQVEINCYFTKISLYSETYQKVKNDLHITLAWMVKK